LASRSSAAQGRTAGRGTRGVEGPGGQRQKDGSTALSSSNEAKTCNLSMRFLLYDFNLLKEHVSVYLLFFFWSQRAPPSISSKETAHSYYKVKCTSKAPKIT
jgi:hypothetical protein